ncbi:hypothetical protein GALL_534180 [mine drainage metagenome]|uniref:Uncharacterized protein n=1 Tax=mine drainage metagenome TaxID=410659 RepID=A0A1J5PIB8_9ZZZZ
MRNSVVPKGGSRRGGGASPCTVHAPRNVRTPRPGSAALQSPSAIAGADEPEAEDVAMQQAYQAIPRSGRWRLRFSMCAGHCESGF